MKSLVIRRYVSVYVLFLHQILTNRAIAHSRLGDFQEARDDFLMAQQCTVEPRHNIIEDCLQCWQVNRILFSFVDFYHK